MTKILADNGRNGKAIAGMAKNLEKGLPMFYNFYALHENHG
jgi:hypothetical protein